MRGDVGTRGKREKFGLSSPCCTPLSNQEVLVAFGRSLQSPLPELSSYETGYASNLFIFASTRSQRWPVPNQPKSEQSPLREAAEGEAPATRIRYRGSGRLARTLKSHRISASLLYWPLPSCQPSSRLRSLSATPTPDALLPTTPLPPLITLKELKSGVPLVVHAGQARTHHRSVPHGETKRSRQQAFAAGSAGRWRSRIRAGC